MLKDSERTAAAIDRCYAFAWILAGCLGLGLMIFVQQSNRHFSGGRMLWAFVALGGPCSVLALLYSITGLRRRVRLALLDRDLTAFRNSISQAVEEAQFQHRIPHFASLQQRLDDIGRYRPTDPAIVETRTMLEDIERRVLEAAKATGHDRVISPAGLLAVLWRMRSGGRGVLDRIGQGVLLIGIALIVLGAYISATIGGVATAGFVMQWAGSSVLLRRYSPIICLGGSLLLAAVTLASIYFVAFDARVLRDWLAK